LEELVAEAAAREHATVVDRFLAHRGDGSRTTEGLAKVLEAVRAGSVDTLLLSPSPPDQRVWVGPAPDQLALTRVELETLGLEEYAADRADAALIRGCVGSGAEIEPLYAEDPTVADGTAALLRYAV
ncbi:MAG: hypothetical protein ACRDT4_13850, partial [Micromonosporaceae bacterium]